MNKILKSSLVLIAATSMTAGSTGAYFSDSAVVSGNQISTGTWGTHLVINEVYYDVAADKGNETTDEWIELYNPTDTAVSLKKWTITDNNTSVTINSEKSVPAHGFALLSKNGSTWSLHWLVPSGVEIVELGHAIGGGLLNTGDRVVLEDDAGNLVDQMSYGTDDTIFILTGVSEGHSLERKVLGVDTDTAADFIDNATPTPGA